ncbi:hypothetical protein OG592_00915 [Streptomyces avidinii]|uniref:hypothetical protein n=1 Tax=Streptomyces avidinii TaxID=1895 RepID=UPI00386A6CB9|nr:hypothetical protein OG592_00915 [Streptomyces avidinii]
MTNWDQMWTDYLAGLDDNRRLAALALQERFAELGADEPQGWALSQLAEGIPQMARFLILRRLWSESINQWEEPSAIDAIPATHRLLASGADRSDIAKVARAVAFESIASVLNVLDEGCASDVSDDSLPGWRLQETTGDGSPTGRSLGGLHESLLETDPSGNEAGDLWA